MQDARTETNPHDAEIAARAAKVALLVLEVDKRVRAVAEGTSDEMVLAVGLMPDGWFEDVAEAAGLRKPSARTCRLVRDAYRRFKTSAVLNTNQA